MQQVDLYDIVTIERAEKDIIIIGDGSPVDRVLERGILINVFPKGMGLCYHVFGYNGVFREDHREIISSLGSDRIDDVIVFHDDTWQNDTELLCHASRIILCDEEETGGQEQDKTVFSGRRNSLSVPSRNGSIRCCRCEQDRECL